MTKRILLSLSIIAAVAAIVIGGTKAFFSSKATSANNTFTAGTMNLRLSNTGNSTDYHPSVSNTWNFSDMIPGGTPQIDTLYVKNTGTVPGKTLGVNVSKYSQTVGSFENQVRITKMTFGGSNLLEGGAGATIGDYVEPKTCGATATPGNLDSTVSSAVDGEIICVDAGNYTPDTLALNVDNVTLVGMHDPNGSDAAKISGTVSVTGKNVVVRGLNITNPGEGYGVSVTGTASGIMVSDNIIHDIGTTLAHGSAQAISVQTDSESGFTFTGNRIYNVGNLNLDKGSNSGRSAKGIYLGDTGAEGLDNVNIENNIIYHVQASTAPWPSGGNAETVGRGAYGILANTGGTGTSNLVVKNNTIYDLEGLWSHAVGLEGLTTGANVTYNDIHDLVNHKSSKDSIGVQVEENVGTGIVVQHNNFDPNVAYGVVQATSNGHTINAQHNWWGDFTPADHVATVGPTINTANYEGGPVAGFVNGQDQNHNGYADMQDLRKTGITNAPVGLNAGQARALVMGVQVDGPSTGNNFQGASLKTDITVTLNQQ